MSYKIKFSKQAGEDLESIYFYHANNLMNQKEADSISAHIEDAIKALRVFPFRHQVVKDSQITKPVPPHVELRSMVTDNYRIFYCVRGAENEIVILSILQDTGKS